MEFLSKIAEYTIEPFGRLLGRQVGYVIHCRTNIQKLQARVKELKAARETIEDEVAEAKTKGEKIRSDVELWLTTVGEITAKTDELLNDESQAKLKCLHGFCPNLTVRHQISRESTQLAQEVVERYEKRGFSKVSCGILRKEVWGVTTGDYEAFPSRTSIVKKIMDSLKDPNIQRMGVCGIGGVGKTTLVKEVYKQVSEDKKLFDNVVILLDVKKEPNLEAIQKKIVEQLSMDILPDETIVGRGSRLCAKIQSKNVVVILDDVQEKIDLEVMGLPRLPTCKVLLTCRTRDVLSFDKMRADVVFPLDLLGKEETWSLFVKTAGDVIKHKGRIQDIAIQVAEKCGGLPLLVVTVASALKERKKLPAWKVALKQLKGFDKEDSTEKAYLALEWSYNQLDDKELKPLFLLCGIIVKQNHIYMQDLLKYGMGLALFRNVNTVEEARDALDSLVERLKDSCLLMDSDVDGKVRMHDLVCHVANRIAYRDQHVLSVEYGGELVEWPSKDFFKKCSKIFLPHNKIPTLSEVPLECPELEFFHIHNKDRSMKIPSNFFSEMQELKVLDLTMMHMPSLPSSLQCLKKLKTLCLDACTLGDITLLGQLSSLEILSFLQSNVRELPKEIGQLTRLRLLDLCDCTQLVVISPAVISSLVRLEDLRMRNSFNKWVVEGEGSNASLSELKHLSQLSALEIHIPNVDVLPPNLFSHKLERFNISIGDVWVQKDFWRKLMDKTTLNALELKLTNNVEELDEALKLLLKRTEDLSLDETESIINIVQQLDAKYFENLKHLRLQNSIAFTDIINRKVVFPNLVTLIVHGCNNLRLLLSFSMARSLVQLTHLKISACELMQEIISSTRECSEENMDIILSKLKVLKLDKLPNLIRFSTGNHIEFPALEKLKIEDCDKLLEFISDEVAMRSEDSRVCKEIGQGVMEEEENLDIKSETIVQYFLFNKKVGFPSLERLIIDGARELKAIWHVQLARDSFRRLKQVDVQDCNNLVSLFPPSIMGRLNALETLKIWCCGSLEVIFDLGGRSNVKEIHVDTSFPHDQLEHVDCQNLDSINIYRCHSLKQIFPASVAKGLQNVTRLDVDTCDAIKEIVGEEEEKEGLETIPPHFVFSKVTWVELKDLPQLTSFYPKAHASQWPLLAQLEVVGCDKVGIFAAEFSISQKKHEMNHLMSQPQPPFFSINEVVFPNLVTLTVHGCDNLRFLFSFSVARSLVLLEHLKISSCELLQEIVSSTRECGEETMDDMFSKLNSLELEALPNLARFGTAKYIEFPALEELKIDNCVKLVEFIGDKVATTSKDTRICKEIEQRGLEEEENLDVKSKIVVQYILFDKKVRFPSLERLTIDGARELKAIWHVQLARDSFQRLKQVDVQECNNLISLFPPSIMGRLNALETLKIWCCGSLEVIFELRGRNNVKEIHVDTSFPHDQLKRFDCQNLDSINIYKCHSLKQIFPASVARGLQDLTRLDVDKCDAIEEIVGEEEEKEGPETTPPYFVFPKVTSVELTNLPQLTSFYPKTHASQWPLLVQLEVVRCDKVGLFAAEFSISQKKHEMNHLMSQPPFFSINEGSFVNLEDLELTCSEIWNGPPPANPLVFGKLKSITFHGSCAPFSKPASVIFLQRLQNLEKIELDNCSWEAIFVNQGISAGEEIHDDAVMSWALPRVRIFRLKNVDELMHPGNDNSQSLLFPNLETLEVSCCNGLKSLESYAIFFRNLTNLTIYACDGLEYLTSYSVAKSLVQLTTLKVDWCDRIVVIVSSNGDDDADATGSEIAFSRLQHLELTRLSGLQGFCSGNCTLKFLSSMTLQVEDCPIKLKISPEGVLVTEIDHQFQQKRVDYVNDDEEEEEDVETVERNPEILSEGPAS
ncbi:hypothetical protein ABKV19_006089 [Rosa sericea]